MTEPEGDQMYALISQSTITPTPPTTTSVHANFNITGCQSVD